MGSLLEWEEDQPAGGKLVVTQVLPALGFSLNNMRLMNILYILSVSYLRFFEIESHWCHPHSPVNLNDMLAV